VGVCGPVGFVISVFMVKSARVGICVVICVVRW
jgi:hypothetical protein